MTRSSFFSRASLAVGGLAIVALGLAAISAKTFVVYNPSDSVPSGFYIRSGGPIARGVIVTIDARMVDVAYVRQREFGDEGDRFLKRVAATEGDTVCAEGGSVSVNGKPVAERADLDADGAPLPSWTGCAILDAGQVFLLGDHPDSFDGRYWGISERADLTGPWRPLR